MVDSTLDTTRNIATALDGPPVYDAVVTDSNQLSPIWRNWFARFVENLETYMSQYGMFIPKVTTTERNTIQDPQIGQFVFNTTTDTLQVYLNNSGSPRWENVTTTP